MVDGRENRTGSGGCQPEPGRPGDQPSAGQVEDAPVLPLQPVDRGAVGGAPRTRAARSRCGLDRRGPSADGRASAARRTGRRGPSSCKAGGALEVHGHVGGSHSSARARGPLVRTPRAARQVARCRLPVRRVTVEKRGSSRPSSRPGGRTRRRGLQSSALETGSWGDRPCARGHRTGLLELDCRVAAVQQVPGAAP